MFTGLIQKIGTVKRVSRGAGFVLEIAFDPWSRPLEEGESVAVNGVCLTVVKCGETRFTADVLRETESRTGLGELIPGAKVNLERALRAGDPMGGHIVQGHVDQTAVCTKREDADGSWYFTFEYEPQGGGMTTVEKGSVAVNGVSLTVCDPTPNSFRVAIIPYPYEHTNFHAIEPGTVVNLEFDIVGKYIARLMENYLHK